MMKKAIKRAMVGLMALAVMIVPGTVNCKASEAANKAEVQFNVDNATGDKVSGVLKIDTCDSITGEAIDKVGDYEFMPKMNKYSYFVDFTSLADGSGEHWFVAEFKVSDESKYTVTPQKYHVRVTRYGDSYGVSVLDINKAKVDDAKFVISKKDTDKKTTSDSSKEIDTGTDTTINQSTVTKNDTDTIQATPVKTGDDTNVLALVAIAGTALMTIVIVIAATTKTRKKNEE